MRRGRTPDPGPLPVPVARRHPPRRTLRPQAPSAEQPRSRAGRLTKWDTWFPAFTQKTPAWYVLSSYRGTRHKRVFGTGTTQSLATTGSNRARRMPCEDACTHEGSRRFSEVGTQRTARSVRRYAFRAAHETRWATGRATEACEGVANGRGRGPVVGCERRIRVIVISYSQSAHTHILSRSFTRIDHGIIVSGCGGGCERRGRAACRRTGPPW